MRDYLPASDLQRLPEETVRLYDDTALAGKVLLFGVRRAPAARGGDGIERLRWRYDRSLPLATSWTAPSSSIG